MKPSIAQVDVIVPVYCDAPALRRSLPLLLKRCPPERILVVLGASDPAAEAIVDAAGVSRIQASRKGRGRQMNEAAAKGNADILLFLHADTALPVHAFESVARAIEDGCVGGAFSRRYDDSAWFLRLTCWLADWRGRWFGWFLGDQAIFARREVFDRLGGFKDWEAFEDLDFSRRMRRLGQTRLIKPGVVTSARRFAPHGPVRQTLADFSATIRHLLNDRRRGRSRKRQ